ncbi:MAG: hypothetical protein C0483_18455 [Pirellula sp.]|nr:hypothetical protein [Pirellula sp.]
MTIVLGCDLGAHLGYALGDSTKGNNGEIIECDVLELEDRAKRLRCSRATALHVWARDFLKEKGVEVFCREASIEALRQQLNQRGYKSEKDLGRSLEQHSGYATVLEVQAEIRKLTILKPIDPRALKKFATNNGNAKKDQMTRAAQLLYKLTTDNENACDAAHVCAWAMKQVRNEALKYRGVDW